MNGIGNKLRTIWAQSSDGQVFLEVIIVSGKVIQTAAAAILALCLGTGFAFASADDAIKGRQGCMKASGKMMGELAAMFKGEKPYDKAAVAAAIAAHDAACADWANWWGPDTQKGETVETWAKPEIWTDAAGFTAVLPEADPNNVWKSWVRPPIENKSEAEKEQWRATHSAMSGSYLVRRRLLEACATPCCAPPEG